MGNRNKSNHTAMKKASAAAEEFFGQGVSRTGFSIPWAPDRCRETWWTVLGGPWVWGTWGCRRLRPRHGTSVPSRGLARRVRVRGSEGRGARVGAGPWALRPAAGEACQSPAGAAREAGPWRGGLVGRGCFPLQKGVRGPAPASTTQPRPSHTHTPSPRRGLTQEGTGRWGLAAGFGLGTAGGQRSRSQIEALGPGGGFTQRCLAGQCGRPVEFWVREPFPLASGCLLGSSEWEATSHWRPFLSPKQSGPERVRGRAETWVS